MLHDGADVIDAIRRELSGGGAVAVTGGRGAGRTTLVRELAAALPSSWRRVHAEGATTDALALPAGDTGGTVVLVVDDPHLLAGAPRRQLAGAVASGLPLLCTVTDEDRVPGDVHRHLLDALRVPVEPLDDAALAAMAAARLGAAPDDVGLALLARLTGRRPGLLQRLLQGARARVEGDVAVVTDEVLTSDGALTWRRERLTDPQLHRVARLLSRGEGLRRDQVAAIVGADTVEQGLTLGLVRADGDGLELRDPLLHAVGAGPDRVTHGPDDAAALSSRLGSDVDEEQRGLWAVEAGQDVDGSVRAAVVGRELARDRPTLALRLVGTADQSPQVVAVRARSLAAVGRAADAVRVLEELVDAGDDVIAAEAAVRLADHRFFRDLDPRAALDVLGRVSTGSGPLATEVAALQALVRSALGHEEPAARGVPGPSATARLVADLRMVLAGRVQDVADVALLDVQDSPAGLPLRERSLTNRTLAGLHLEGVRAGRTAAAEQVRSADASGRPGALALALGMRAFVEQLGGRLVPAERTLRAAALRAAVDDEAGLPELIRAQRASILAELGRLDEAAAELPDGEVRSNDLRVRLLGAPARIRVQAVTDPAAASEVAIHDIGLGLATGHNVWAVLAGLQAARVGLAAAVVGSVTEAANGTVGLARVAAQVVQALAGDDDTARRDAAGSAAGFGLRRVAAELLLRPAAPVEDRQRASALLAGLGPPRPDAALHTEQLTPRELQVARLAASGRTSRDICDQLGVSVRTVDNHLRRVYRKLGISGRGELATVLVGFE